MRIMSKLNEVAHPLKPLHGSFRETNPTHLGTSTQSPAHPGHHDQILAQSPSSIHTP
jgi:hypothetical protein